MQRRAAGLVIGAANARVPHISLVFREMWDTTDFDRSLHRTKRESEGRSSGIPHLAKNERDVGHPSFRGEDRGVVGEVPLSFRQPAFWAYVWCCVLAWRRFFHAAWIR